MLIDLIKEESPSSKLKLLLASLVPGFADAGLIAIIQAGIYAARDSSTHLFFVFCGLCVLQTLCLRQCIRAVATVTEEALYRLRCRVADKIRNAELQGLERIGSGEIYARLTQATTTISNSCWSIASIAQAGVLLICVAFYILLISPTAFAFVMLFYGGGGAVFYLRRRRVRQIMIQAASSQMQLFKRLDDLLEGAKEIRLRVERGNALLEAVRQMAEDLKVAPFQINRILQQNFVTARLFLFLLLGTLIFVLPQISAENGPELNALLVNAIFMFSPLAALLRSIPEYERAELAAAGIQALETRLEGAISTELAPAEPRKSFSQIDAIDLCFEYKDADGGQSFSIGPASLSIKAGEIIFFVGGNGSGKTTLLKVLSGLYPPSSGSLLVDGVAVGPDNLQSYREMVSAIFTDFHLFQKLYGIADKGTAEVVELLDKMQMSKRTEYTEQGFTRLNLSTGQKKRVAMVVALLEERPIYIFDEWAADQDPEFRHYYYQELLPELKKQGKTVLAISHDDRYFGCADRVVTMEYGAIRSISAHRTS